MFRNVSMYTDLQMHVTVHPHLSNVDLSNRAATRIDGNICQFMTVIKYGKGRLVESEHRYNYCFPFPLFLPIVKFIFFHSPSLTY